MVLIPTSIITLFWSTCVIWRSQRAFPILSIVGELYDVQREGIDTKVLRTKGQFPVLVDPGKGDFQSERCVVCRWWDDPAGSSRPHHKVRSEVNHRSAAASDPKFAKYIACTIVLQGLGEAPAASVMSYQEDPGRCGVSFLNDTVRKQGSTKLKCTQHCLDWGALANPCTSTSQNGSYNLRNLLPWMPLSMKGCRWLCLQSHLIIGWSPIIEYWGNLSARILQEYELLALSKFADGSTRETAFAVTAKREKKGNKKRMRTWKTRLVGILTSVATFRLTLTSGSASKTNVMAEMMTTMTRWLQGFRRKIPNRTWGLLYGTPPTWTLGRLH